MYKVTIKKDGEETIIHSPHFGNVKVSEGKVKQAINIPDGFNFTVIPSNPGYTLIRPLQTLIEVENTQTGKVEFDGRILMPTETMSDSGTFSKSFVCESELSFLNDSSQRHGEYHDITVRDFLQVIIDNHNADVAEDEIDKQFSLGIVDVGDEEKLYRYLGYEKTLDTIKDKLINRLGGELRVRKENGVRYLDYLQIIGEKKSTEIRLAKNLKSITKEIDLTDIITRLVPLGKTIESEDEGSTDASQARVTIESVNGGRDYLIDEAMEKAIGTVIVGVETWDDVSVPSILKSRGEQYIQENNRPKSQHKVSALDLSLLKIDPDEFEVGNWHPVINKIMNIDEDLRIIGKTIDIINPENNDLTVGDKFKTASEYQHEMNQSQKSVIDLKNTVERQNSKIGVLSTDLSNAKDELEQTKQQLQNFEDITDGDIQAIVSSINTILDSIESLEELIEGVEGLITPEDVQQITTNKNDIAMLVTDVQTNTNDISDNKTNIQANADDITSIFDALVLISGEIDNIKTRLDNGGL